MKAKNRGFRFYQLLIQPPDSCCERSEYAQTKGLTDGTETFLASENNMKTLRRSHQIMKLRRDLGRPTEEVS